MIKDKKAKGKPGLGRANNISAAAARTGLPERVVKAAKESGCPAWRPNNTIECDELMAWVAANPDFLEQQGERPDKELEDALLTRAKRQLAETKLDEQKRILVPAENVKRAVGKQILAAKQKLYSAKGSIVSAAAMKLGLNEESCLLLSNVIHEHHVAVLKEMNKGEWGNPVCPHCEKPIGEKGES